MWRNSFTLSITVLAFYIVVIDQVTQITGNSVSSTSNSDSVDSAPSSIVSDRLNNGGNENTNTRNFLKHEYENHNRMKRMHSGYYNGNNGIQRNLKLVRAMPVQSELLEDDDVMFDFNKRYNDYGHMRFGKRGGEGDQFDDYGHMRFGRSLN